MDDEVEAVAKALKEHRINRAECACGMSVWMEDPEDHWATVAVAALDAHRATVPHVITTVEELEALPERTVLLDSEGCVLQVVEFDCPNHGEGDYCVWDGCTGRQRWYDGIGSRSGSEVVYLPATILALFPPAPVTNDDVPKVSCAPSTVGTARRAKAYLELVDDRYLVMLGTGSDEDYCVSEFLKHEKYDAEVTAQVINEALEDARTPTTTRDVGAPSKEQIRAGAITLVESIAPKYQHADILASESGMYVWDMRAEDVLRAASAKGDGK